jgi:hypothetical protein
MNQNLEFATIEQLHADLGQRGYEGSALELQDCLQNAFVANQERAFWSMLGRPVGNTVGKHPLPNWLAALNRHFDSISYYSEPGTLFGSVFLEGRKESGDSARRQLVKDVKVQVKASAVDAGWDCIVAYYNKRHLSRRRVFHVPSF